ncbi:NADPH-dependent F420 reductase [Ideonella livida]|uniref:NAD(P)-binding domain-containing protein n=1 Tax=Ideonella livida TaxID=2707176 RepID=A0A7C9PJT7_9BURK|nr:NAD(P)-binding domain-containing protein [Ideonella livida]NDY93796.1 NAD(P)-binding domain-containing protein [Ideonella livida]
MRITVIGAGNMGSAFVQQLTRAGHEVAVSARDAAKATALAAAHPGARAVPAAGAARGADVVVLATGYADATAALAEAAPEPGQAVVDITNPLTADYMGLTLGHSTSAAEEIARAVPGVALVKGFNTLFAPLLAAGPDLGEGRRASVFLASDSAPAKQTVRTLTESLGFAVVDAGGLKNARYLEPLAGLNIYLGYGAGLGTGIAPAWLHKAA